MAKKGEARTWNDESYYEIKLLRPVEWPVGSQTYLNPGHSIKVKGRVAKQIEDAIADAHPVTG